MSAIVGCQMLWLDDMLGPGCLQQAAKTGEKAMSDEKRTNVLCYLGFITPPKFNIWKTSLSYWVWGNFSGAMAMAMSNFGGFARSPRKSPGQTCRWVM